MPENLLVTLRAIDAEHRARGGLFVKCNWVMLRALEMHGALTDAASNQLRDESLPWDKPLVDAYDSLVNIVREGQLAEGQGNFGGDDYPPAHPKFVECRLTEAGRRLL